MDTKLKKTHRITVLIIALCILIPALVLVLLYPGMEKEMLKRKAQYEKETESAEETLPDISLYSVSESLVNYAMEASYYLYGLIAQEIFEEEMNFQVLDENGWINDYYTLHEQSEYFAEYTGDASGSRAEKSMKNTDKDLETLLEDPEETFLKELSEEGAVGYLLMKYNSFGQISDIRFEKLKEDAAYKGNAYRAARNSTEQYQQNAMYAENREAALQVCPKDFQAVFVIYEDSMFVNHIEEFFVHQYRPGTVDFYWAMGAEWIVLICAGFVALAACLLPLIKRLHTGWERLFCLPFEIIVILAGTGIAAACGMFIFMSHSTMDEVVQAVNRGVQWQLIGYTFTEQTQYALILILNFLGWAACFLMEYIVVSAFRQFLCGPWKYLKKRSLIVRWCVSGKSYCRKGSSWCWRYCKKFFSWCWTYCKKLYGYLKDIEITSDLKRSILKIVGLNLAVLAGVFFFCRLFFGITGQWFYMGPLHFLLAGFLVYSAALYFLILKYAGNLQKQYQSVLKATEQMANGDLKIALDEELGIFAPLGKELERVQQGFAKAVAEEAKSQNMKTELITNVSHDLKTPLTSIITYVDLLKREDLSEEERNSYILTLEQKSQRLKVLIEDLFEVSKANSGNVQMNFMEVDIVSLMKQVRLEMENQIRESELSFRWNLPDGKVILSLDGQRTYRVFENLLNNILKYSMPHSRVYIDILDGCSAVLVIFRNISAVELKMDAEKLTERFVQGDASRRSEGSGLGLAIVKSFVELQNGTVEISVDGDLFKVTLKWKKETL